MTENTTNTALVTGASRGLGLALARRLAREGWTLIIDARLEDALESARAELSEHTRVVAIPGDVTDPEHRRMLAEATHEAGGLDALVNNASTLGPSPQPALLEYPIDRLEEVYRTNAIAPLALVQAGPRRAKTGAHIVNVTSDAGCRALRGLGRLRVQQGRAGATLAILAAENPDLRVYHVTLATCAPDATGGLPGRDISDRPLPEESVPGLPGAADRRPAERSLQGPRLHHSGRTNQRDPRVCASRSRWKISTRPPRSIGTL
jgi:NAD(P)-dependent dehydrogenase (short-subunit alcohol dehydrogenase family)